MNINGKTILQGVLILMVLALSACGGGGGSGKSCTEGDFDGDGLSNCSEINTYGTSWVLKDTDGDGFDDYYEINNLGFSANNNNFKFNPLIADIPQVDIEFLTPPDISMNFTDATTDTVMRSNTSSNTVIETETDFTSTTLEVNVEAKVNAFGGQLKANVNTSTTWEKTNTLTEEQTNENQTALTNSTTKTMTDGKLAVAVNIVNRGNIAYTVKNLVLGSTALYPEKGSVLKPIGNMDFDTSFGSFQPFTIAPNSSAGPLKFSTKMDVATTRKLLGSSKGLSVNVAAQEIAGVGGESYTLQMTDVLAKTAAVIIDYGGKGGHAIEKYQVATNTDPSVLHVTLKKVLESYLRIPYTASTGLDDLRGVASAAPNVFWLIVKNTTRDGMDEMIWYDPRDAAYDLADITIKSGDAIRLVYMDDADGDKIGLRQELIFGTDPTKADTDGDGLDDLFELDTGWIDGYTGQQVYPSALSADWDGDGLDDAAELAATTNPKSADTDGDGLLDGVDPAPLVNSLVSPWHLVSAGYWHNLGIRSDGSLWSWGNNDYGELGLGDTTTRYNPTMIDDGTGGKWIAVAAGQNFSLAIRESAPGSGKGQLFSWGSNSHGQLGRVTATTCIDPSSSPPVAVPCDMSMAQVGSVADWTVISAGGYHAAGIQDADVNGLGSIHTWGANWTGQLGSGNLTDQATPQVIDGGTADWIDVDAGQYHTIANKGAGYTPAYQIFSWGYNGWGQLGINQTVGYVTVPTKGGQAQYINAGYANSVVTNDALDPLGAAVYVAGWSSLGQAGYYGTTNWSWNKLGDWGLLKAETFDVGTNFLVGIKSSGTPGQGTLWAWGDNGYGQLGRGFVGSYCYCREQIGTSAEWTLVSTGNAHTLALKTNGKLYGFGDNVHGQIGQGDPSVSGFTIPSPALIK